MLVNLPTGLETVYGRICLETDSAYTAKLSFISVTNQDITLINIANIRLYKKIHPPQEI